MNVTKDLFRDIEVAVGRSVSTNYRKWWHCIEMDHESDTFDKNNRVRLLEQIKKLRTNKGLYIYEFTDPVDSSIQTLYVGKSKQLDDRIWHHYKERHRLCGMPKWQDFWSSHKYKMNVYVHEVQDDDNGLLDEACRIISERYFIVTLNPISERLYKSVK